MAISSEVVAFESNEDDEPILISVVAPTLNEIDNIGNYIQSVSDNLKEIGRFEIVIVDDNSKDGTREFLSERKEVDPNLKVLFNDKREGLSSSQLEGIDLCNGDYTIVMDSDLQHPAEKIKDIVSKLEEGYDLVVCSRYVDGGSVGNRNPIRGVISRGAIALTHLFIAQSRSLKDPVSGFYGLRKGLKTSSSGYCRGYKSLLYPLVMNKGIRVTEIPFDFRKRVKSSSKIVANWRFFINYLMEMLYVLRLSHIQKRTNL